MPKEYCPPYCGGIKANEQILCDGCYYDAAIPQDFHFTTPQGEHQAVYQIGVNVFDTKGIGHHKAAIEKK